MSDFDLKVWLAEIFEECAREAAETGKCCRGDNCDWITCPHCTSGGAA